MNRNEGEGMSETETAARGGRAPQAPPAEVRSEQSALLLEAQRLGRMGSWAFHADTGEVQWSDYTCELFGIAPADFQGTVPYVMNLILPEDREILQQAHLQVSPDSPLLEAEYRIRRPDGTVRWMREQGRAIFDAEGRLVTRLGMVMDITERKRADDQLAHSEALARIASRVARVGGWTIDLPERRLTWSDENCAIHDAPPGYQPTLDEGIALFAPEHRDHVRALVAECARNGEQAALIMFDLDHFKAVNDGHGHLVGDQTLVEFCSVASDRLPARSAFGRLGGEEFAVMIDGCWRLWGRTPLKADPGALAVKSNQAAQTLWETMAAL